MGNVFVISINYALHPNIYLKTPHLTNKFGLGIRLLIFSIISLLYCIVWDNQETDRAQIRRQFIKKMKVL